MWNFLSGAVAPITNALSRRADRKADVATRQIERLSKADDKLAEWELIQAESGRFSWKDEYWTIVLSLPAILAFHPDYAQHVMNGFDAIAKMPDFYQYWLGVAVLTSFGVRIWRR